MAAVGAKRLSLPELPDRFLPQRFDVKTLYLAVPTHSGTITTSTAVTLVDLQKFTAGRLDIQVVFHSASVISDLRNIITADFLASGRDALFMLDSDQGIPAPLIVRMIETGHPFVGCLYPRRNFFWDPSRAVPAGVSFEQLIHRSMRYVGQLLVDENSQAPVVNGFARASHVGGGAMLIRREVFERMRECLPELAGIGFPNEDENIPRAAHNYGFFNPIHDSATGRHLGEDVSFCERWRVQCGGEIWANVDVTTEHIGRHVFRGNYVAHVQSLESGTDPVRD